MEGTIFVNDAISYAINMYLSSKTNPNGMEYNSFYSNVIKALVYIYGELDVINPFRANHETGIGGFDENLKKFGAPDTLLVQFKQNMLLFHQAQDNEQKKEPFIEIQKNIIDMLFYKAKHVFISDEEIESFKQFLYYSGDTNQIKLNFYSELVPNSTEIMDYLKSKIFSSKHNYTFTEMKDIFLNAEAYQLAGFNAIEVMKMSEEEIHNVNSKVYHFFRIKSDDLNKKKRLENAILFYKKYGKMITSGSGFVDTLLFLSMITTTIMIAMLFLSILVR